MQLSWWLLDFVLCVSCLVPLRVSAGSSWLEIFLSHWSFNCNCKLYFYILKIQKPAWFSWNVIFKTLLITNRMYFSSVIYCTLHCRDKMYYFKIMLLLDESLSISQSVLKNSVLPFFLWVTEMWTCGIVCCDFTNHFARYKK